MTTSPAEKVTFRARTRHALDTPFLYATFLKSFKDSDEVAGIPGPLYFETFKREFAQVLERFTILVAHPEGDEDEIAGWIAYSGPVVCWIYVKRSPWRQMGVAKFLAAAAALPKRVSAIYGHPRGIALAESKGYTVTMLTHAQAMRMLVAP